MIDPALLMTRLGLRLGHDLSAGTGESQGDLWLRFEGIAPPNGFCIAIKLGWRSIDAVFTPDTFASALVKTVCSDDLQRRQEFSALVAAFTSCGITCVLRIDDRAADPAALPLGQWSHFELSCSRLTDKSDEQRDAEEVAGACLALVLALLPVDSEAAESSHLDQGLPEGAVTRIAVNRYERRPANRAAAIAIHGLRCMACGFNFGKTYGSLGAGFIEIHHLVPVSRMGPGYVVVPEKDLAPLCSNCHQMVHRRDPPMSIDELRALLDERVRDETGKSAARTTKQVPCE